MIKGRKVYDPLTDTWSTGYWVADDKGNYYPVWQKGAEMDRLTRRSSNGVAVYAAPSADAVKWKNTRYEVLQKLADYEDLEERLNKVYGDCDGLLLRVVSMLEKHPNIDMANNTLKSRLLTDEDVDKWEEYKQSEEQGRLVKLPLADDKAERRECVHTKATCHHKECKCSECPLTELFCDEFYKAIDRCYEEAYASGCLAGIELGESEAEAKLKELRGGEK